MSANFDTFFANKNIDIRYTGNPPTTKEDYDSRIVFPNNDKVSWEEVEAGVALTKCQKERLEDYHGGPRGGWHIQLEKLWDDIDAGKFGETAKTGQFYTYVKNIKEKHPKP